MIVQIVQFQSALDDSDVVATYNARAHRYRQVPGLLQKYYLAFESGEHGAVYLWESRQAMQDFRQTDLARSIPDAYKVQGEPHVQIGETVMLLHSGTPAPA